MEKDLFCDFLRFLNENIDQKKDRLPNVISKIESSDKKLHFERKMSSDKMLRHQKMTSLFDMGWITIRKHC